MRADRLVALLLMLQRRGRVTAGEVAAELEVSERTARRDLEALGAAGLPVYAQQGRNGGWHLLGGARTDLSGLSEGEVRALFLLAGPAAATPELKGALRKLVRALPEPFRADAEATSGAIVIDRSSWDGQSTDAGGAQPQHLDEVQRAVVQGRQIELGYVGRTGEASDRTVHPLGLAAKGRVWYVIGDTDRGLRTFRVDRIRSLRVTNAAVVRPTGFVLADAWKLISEEISERRLPVAANADAASGSLGFLRRVFGTRLRIGATDDHGHARVEIRGWNEQQLGRELAPFVHELTVLGPPAVRAELRRVGAELVERYGDRVGRARPARQG